HGAWQQPVSSNRIARKAQFSLIVAMVEQLSSLAYVMILACLASVAWAASPAIPARVHEVVELEFAGPEFGPADKPAVDVELTADFTHESGQQYRIHGFWDGDGKGGSRGGVFKVRFCPTLPGTWTLARVSSNSEQLN